MLGLCKYYVYIMYKCVCVCVCLCVCLYIYIVYIYVYTIPYIYIILYVCNVYIYLYMVASWNGGSPSHHGFQSTAPLWSPWGIAASPVAWTMAWNPIKIQRLEIESGGLMGISWDYRNKNSIQSVFSEKKNIGETEFPLKSLYIG